jgi:hypothetical protein
MFDDDQDPATGEKGYIINKAKGTIDEIYVKEYKPITLNPNNRKIIIVFNSEYGKVEIPFTYRQWKEEKKGKLANDNYQSAIV